MAQRPLLQLFLMASALLLAAVVLFSRPACAESMFGEIRGVTRGPIGQLPLARAHVTAHEVDANIDCEVMSDADGSFSFENLKPGHYRINANKAGFAGSRSILFAAGVWTWT
jgi:hypothetical protein